MWPDLGAVRDGIIFNILNMIAGILWVLDKILLIVAAILHWFRVLLVGGGGQDNLLGILMTQLLQGNELLKHLVYLGLMLAFVVLAFTLIARPLIGPFQAVDFNKVILWFFIAVIIFSAGPGMVAAVEGTRLGLQEQAHLISSTINYQNEVNRHNNQVVPNTVGDFWLPGQTPGYVPHLFGTAVGSDCPAGCNGLDAAAAFLGAEEGDITGARGDAQNTGGYPRALYDKYFTWREGNQEEREASLRNARDGVMRVLEGMLPSFFAVVEAAIFLLFGIAALVLFISLPIAIPFAFFSMTEIIAASVLRAYLFLVVRTFVVATMLAFLVEMLIIFAQRGTALVFVAISALTMLLSLQFVRMAASTVTEALNVIGSAVGSATGVRVRQTDPFAAAGRVAGMAAIAGTAAVTGGGALVGAAALLHRQGGLRGGGLGAVGSAALHAARVRSGALVGRTPLAGLQRGYSAMQEHHQLAREHAYQLETARALALDRDADEAAAILMEQKRTSSPQRREWARKKVGEWITLEEGRQRYRVDMRAAGMGRLGWKGYSRSWTPLPTRAASAPTPEADAGASRAPGADATGTEGATSASQSPNPGPGTGKGGQAAHRSPGAGTVNRSAPAITGAGSAGSAGSAPSQSSSPGSPGSAHMNPDGGAYVLTTPRARGDGGVLNPELRTTAHDAVLVQNKAVALAGNQLVVYGGVQSEDDPTLGRYDMVPVTPDVTADIVDLLQKGKHVQRSRKRPGFLMVWDGAQGPVADGFSSLASRPSLPSLPSLPSTSPMPPASSMPIWSGADVSARHQVLSDVRDLADQAGQGHRLRGNLLEGKLSHLSVGDRQRLAAVLQEGNISPDGVVRVLEAATEVADGIDNPQLLLDEFLGPNGYLDLASPGVAAIMSLAESRGGAVQMQPAGIHEASPPGSSSRGVPSWEVPAADLALLISVGLGLKRTVPWSQVKGAIVQASVSGGPDALEPVRAVSEDLGAASLRTSMAPIKRFVETARFIDMSEIDVAVTLDVAGTAGDMGAVIAAVSEKDAGKRRAAWRAAGVPRDLVAPLDRARHNALRKAPGLAPSSMSGTSGTSGMAGNRAREAAEEMFGTLLAEGMTINSELYSVPIETYSAHPFTVEGSKVQAAPPAGTKAAVPRARSQPPGVPLNTIERDTAASNGNTNNEGNHQE